MTSISICDELFQYVCKLTRSAEQGARFDRLQIASQVTSIIDHVESEIHRQNLGAHWATVKQLLVYFVDSMICSSRLQLAHEWSDNRLADKLFGDAQMAGDEKFYFLISETINRDSVGSENVLAVAYLCFGLGFVGVPPRAHLQSSLNVPEDLDEVQVVNRIMNIIRPKIRMSGDKDDPLMESRSYYVDTTDMRWRPGMGVGLVFIVVIVMILFLVLANGQLFDVYTSELRDALDAVLENTGATEVSPEE